MNAVACSSAEVYSQSMTARARGDRVGVVMTMGALHEGHLNLVRSAVDQCDFVIVTIFVNPTQFGPGEDFDAYPRDLQQDLAALRALEVDLIFTPETSDLFPGELTTFISPPAVASPLEGIFRPDHFRGVCTVVAKLLHITAPHLAFFGQKDYQQYLVIRDMARDLDFPTQIMACPTSRDADGLALSSRNRYLTSAERSEALAIPEALALAVQMVRDGSVDSSEIEAAMTACLARPQITLDYAVIADPDTLQPLDRIRGTAIAAIAARVGSTRLIDNRLIETDSDSR